jgi:hypothetical protein
MHGTHPSIPEKNHMFFLSNRRSHLALLLILALYMGLGLGLIKDMGVVGEVAWVWMSGAPMEHHAATLQTHTFGPLTAATTRPVETLHFGSFSLPLAVNFYTGGLADWPARIAASLGLSYDGTMVMNMIFGGMLIALVHRFTRTHGSRIAANAAALLLATDWVFIFFRRALGGTELLLSAASLICLWALWDRRWAGGRHGLTALALGIGLGLTAKLTFMLTLIPLAVTAWVMRWDKPKMGPPLPNRWTPMTLAVVIPLVPLIISMLHHAWADLPALASHDHLHLQLRRVWGALSGGPQPARESLAALLAWIGDPRSFLGVAWGASAPAWFSPLRFLGWAVIAAGVFTAWCDRDATPRLALARFCSVFLVTQVALIWGVARDLHHIAIATPTLMILAGLSLEALMGRWSPPRSNQRGLLVALVCLPWVILGIHSISKTDASLRTIQRATVSRSGQNALVSMLREQGVTQLVTMDYEAAGSLDILAPEIEFKHGWVRIAAERKTALVSLLDEAKGAHLLVIPAAPSWIYNLKPREADLAKAAAQAGAVWEEVDRLPGDAGVLYRVEPKKDRP